MKEKFFITFKSEENEGYQSKLFIDQSYSMPIRLYLNFINESDIPEYYQTN